MIKDVNYQVTFPTNGISLKGSFSMQPGITAVVGDNGSGKTFGSIEIPRYLLFGKKALRGPAKDYKTLTASMTFVVRGTEYLVERSAKTEKLTDATGETLAVGAEAVTQKIVQILGFGLDVFDVVCCSVQKDTDRLTKLRPAERKALIDEVIGLSATEKVEKDCRDEAKGLKREAEALADALVEPVKPVKPADYDFSSSLSILINAERALQIRHQQLQTVINGVGPAPTVVETPTGDIEALVSSEAARQKLEIQREHAQQELNKIPTVRWTAEELNIAEAYAAHVAVVESRGPKPAITKAEAETLIEEWQARAAIEKLGDTEIVCPKCDHLFKPGADLEAPPHVSLADARLQLKRCLAWADYTPVDAPVVRLSAAEIREGRLALARAGDISQLEALAAAEIPVDRSAELNQLRRQAAQYEAYVQAKAVYEARCEDATNAAIELEDLAPVGDIEDLERRHVEARVYESQEAAFILAQVRYNELIENVREKTAKSAAFKAGAEALVKARQTVKAHLAPSLSRVSSRLIHEMSGGVFTHMIIDDEMNVSVDGQDISTLSGAGSTVANLALRLALGQVLVNSVFPVFIADEADSDLSHSRAQFTSECLKNLKSRLSQIIIITHKEVTVADHVITR